jgi:hypothetical protein
MATAIDFFWLPLWDELLPQAANNNKEQLAAAKSNKGLAPRRKLFCFMYVSSKYLGITQE